MCVEYTQYVLHTLYVIQCVWTTLYWIVHEIIILMDRTLRECSKFILKEGKKNNAFFIYQNTQQNMLPYAIYRLSWSYNVWHTLIPNIFAFRKFNIYLILECLTSNIWSRKSSNFSYLKNMRLVLMYPLIGQCVHTVCVIHTTF